MNIMSLLLKLSFLLSFLPSYLFAQIHINKSPFSQLDSDIGMTNLSHFDSSSILLQTLSELNLVEFSSTKEVQKIDSIVSTLSPIYNQFSKFIFEYNEKNLIDSYTSFNLYNNHWQVSDRTILTYDSLNYLIKEKIEHWNGGFWANDFQRIIEFNDMGSKVFVLDQVWVDNEWVNIYKTISNYDTSNNLINIISYSWVDSLWVFSLKSEFKYSLNNKVDEIRIYDFEQHWQKVFFSKYYYGNNNLDSIIVHKWNGISWVKNFNLHTDTLKYGSQINAYLDAWVNDEWKKSTRIVSYYDKDKYFLHSHCEYWQGDRWLPNMDIIHILNPDGFEIHYLTHQVDIYYDEPTDIRDEEQYIPVEFELYQNYPNPFNPTTTIRYSIPIMDANSLPTGRQVASTTTNVQLKVYDLLGREITNLVNEEKKPGTYEVKYDGSELSSGIYFYKIKVAGSNGHSIVETKKMMLAK